MPAIAAFFLIALPWLNPFSPGPSAAVVPLLFSWACAAALIGVACLAPQRPWGARLVDATALAWLAAALLSAALGLLQYVGATAVFGPWVNSTGLGEAFANLRQRNQFASLTNIGLLALLWWAAQGQAGRRLPGSSAHLAGGSWPTAVLVALALLLGAGNAASSSRTGLLQLGLVLALALVWGQWRAPHARRVLLAALLGYTVASLALPWLAGLDPLSAGAWARLRAGDDACASRLTLWGNVLHLITQKPWLGWGWGELDYAHFITLYPGARFCDILDNAHNLPLQLAVELGVPAALAACGAGLWLLWRARPWRERDATRQLAWGVLAVILLHSLLEYPLWYGPFQMAAGLCVWLLWRRPQTWPAAGAVASSVALVGSAAVALMAVAALGYAAWDYQRISQIYRIPAMRWAPYREQTLEKIGASWLFRHQVRFAELTTTPVTPDNAARLRALALTLLHFSPEPRVVEALLESAALLGLEDEVRFYQARYQAAFPEQQARWARNNGLSDAANRQ